MCKSGVQRKDYDWKCKFGNHDHVASIFETNEENQRVKE